MRLEPDQLEWIVREVVRRLLAGQPSSTGAATRPAVTGASGATSELNVTDRVVTTARLDGRLAGVATVRVGARAIVTPAVVDLLADRGVSLVRDQC